MISVRVVDLRDYAMDRHRVTDDYPYGGGQGMVMKPEPLIAAIEAQEDLIAGVHQVTYGYHRSLSKRFPFAIYYSIEQDLVHVHAVLDCRRNPSWIRKRLKEND